MRKVYPLLLLAASLFICSNLMSQDIFLKVAGVDGGSYAAGFEKQIEVLSFAQANAGCANSTTSYKDGACKVIPSSFIFMTRLDPAQVPLKKILYTGKLIPTVTASFVRTGGDGVSYVYYIIRLENVLIGSIQESAASELPTFSTEFIPQKISWIQYSQKANGSLEKIASFGWDISKNAEFVPAD